MPENQPAPPAVPEPHGPPVPPPTERDLRRDATIEYELITAAMPSKSRTDKATSDLILGWIRRTAHAEAALAAERERAEAGAKFKAFVHSYLTQHGVPEGDPENAHQKQGYRIGARLDWLLGSWRGLEKANELLRKGMESQCESMDTLKQEARRLTAENAALRERAEKAEAMLNAPESERLKAMQAVVSAQAREVTQMSKCLGEATDSAISACEAAARMQAERDAALAEVEGLRRGLEPFAEMWRRTAKDMYRDDARLCLDGYGGGSPSFGDCRRASELLERPT